MKLLLPLTLLILLVSGCGSSPKSTYYTLSAPPIPAELNTNKTRIMVGPVSLPELIDRPQLVVQVSGNEVAMQEYHRWAGSLKGNIGNAIVANLARDLATSNVWSFSQTTQSNYDYQIVVDVQNMDSKLGESVLVDVLWTIKPVAITPKSRDMNTDGSKPKSMMGRSVVREPVTNSQIESLVTAQSRAFAKVSNEIAQSIRGK